MTKKFLNKFNVGVVLVPKKEQERELRSVIDGLAKRYGSYGFVPHITVYITRDKIAPKEIKRVLREEIKDIGLIETEAVKVGYSDSFTKTLYVAYKKSDSLVNFYSRLRKRWGEVLEYELNPHLSLIYSTKMSVEDKKREAEKVIYPKRLVLDRVEVIVGSGEGIKKEEDVLDWKVAFEAVLG